MKNFTLLLAAVILFAGCNGALRTKGPVTSEKRNAAGFHALTSDGVAEITIVYDSSSYVVVTTNQNFLPYIITEVDGGTLQISQKHDFSLTGDSHIKVSVHTPLLSEITLSGVGSIKSENPFPFNHLNLQLNGVGNINVAGSAHNVVMENSGAGSINCKTLAADTVMATNAGVGSIACNAIKYLKADVTGVGSISYTGNPVVDKSVSGVGSVHHE